MGQEDASIFCGVLASAPKLVGVEVAEGGTLKLKTISNHLFYKFPQSVQQHNRPEHLWGGIMRLLWFGNNHRQRGLEVRWPVHNPKAGIGQCEKVSNDLRVIEG